MTSERWHRIEQLYHSALGRAPGERAAYLAAECAGDEELRREVESLLSNEREGGAFLERPALEVAAEQYVSAVTADLTGRKLGRYEVVSRLGAGGMGEVYRARDTRLKREVALKVLPREWMADAERKRRFEQEARAASALDHPNIVTIHDIDQVDGVNFIAMEYVPGKTLDQVIPRRGLRLKETLQYAVEIAGALAAAHGAGIVHRDIKPSNLMVTGTGQVKVLDFGLAKLVEPAMAGEEGTASTLPVRTEEGAVVGTVSYMSPEQAQGKPIDARSDIFSFGSVLYEMVTGRRAFQGDTKISTLAAIVEHEPPPLSAAVPQELKKVITRCLRKDLARRFQHMDDVQIALQELRRGRNHWRFSATQARQPRFAIPVAAILLLLGFLGVRLYQHNSRVRWVREQALPEIRRLSDSGEFQAAFRLIRRAEAVLPNDPTLKQIHHDSSLPTSFSTNPPGAEVWATGYTPEDNDWLRLGATPFTSRELPFGFYRFRIVKPGFQTIVGAGEVRGGTSLQFDLDAEGAIPPEMVRVPGGTVRIPGLDDAKLSAFLIDRYEITNRQFKQFIDHGGYQKGEYWKQDFVKSGRKLSWEEALQLFRDSTGRPGPSTWELGEYPQGHDDYPVNGVSWHEAAAYAEYAGKQLPTIYHWQQAASPGFFLAIAELSNFSGAGPARVGAHKGIGAFGTLDMAGNVKEWCWNETGGQRYIRGGAWNEPVYMFSELDARLPWDRSAQNGIRCVRYGVREESGLQAPVTTPVRDFSQEKPVPDDVFRLYRSLYAYDPTDLDSRVEGIDEENSYWKREKISFAAAYGNERVPSYLYIPKRATPPYQTILYAHPGMAFRLPSPQPGEELFFDFLVKSGRAFLLPVLKGQYQRRYASPPAGPNAMRDRLVLESKDFRRSIDYLVSRPDVDRDRLGVFGLSRGAWALPVLAVGEQRLKAAVLVSVGLAFDRILLPEDDPLNFVPRFEVPTVMVNRRSDFIFPLETSQRPMFRLLGTPEKDKRLLLWDGSHGDGMANYQTTIKETLDWFDRYLGPVK